MPECPGPPGPLQLWLPQVLSAAPGLVLCPAVSGERLADCPQLLPDTGGEALHVLHIVPRVSMATTGPEPLELVAREGLGGPCVGLNFPSVWMCGSLGHPRGQAAPTDRPRTAPPPHPAGRAQGAAALSAPTLRSQAVVSTHTLVHTRHTHTRTLMRSESRRLRHARSHALARPRSHA